MLIECSSCRKVYLSASVRCPFCGEDASDIKASGNKPADTNTNILFECPSCQESFDSSMPRCPFCGADAPDINKAKGMSVKKTVKILFECSSCNESFDSALPRCPFCGTQAPKINPLEKPPPDTNISSISADLYDRIRAAFIDGALSLLILVIVAVIMRGNQTFNLNPFLLLASNACYFIGFEASPLMATPGKLYFGLQITDLKGERLSVFRAAARYAAKYISIPLLGLGVLIAPLLSLSILPMILSKREQPLHDVLAGCMVIKDSLI